MITRALSLIVSIIIAGILAFFGIYSLFVSSFGGNKIPYQLATVAFLLVAIIFVVQSVRNFLGSGSSTLKVLLIVSSIALFVILGYFIFRFLF
ncbi:MAG: hypothetical protein V4664_00960 [Patescibacteria group bacterium]